ncbi:MAG: hydrogenase 4 subunit F [Gammaproteobacteria bacterium]|nr:hydrogenase 4 subunit F [Gammaproteobacteria bacterium]
MLLAALLIVPLLGALFMALLGSRSLAKYISIGCCILTFVFALALGLQINQQGNMTLGNGWFYLDSLNIFIIILTTFIGFTTAVFSLTYLKNEQDHKKLTGKSLRFYHSLYQFFLFTTLLILTTNNLGILWVAMEGATLSTVLLVGLYHMPESLEAAWKYLILCGVGLAQALLGIILLYFAAEKVIDVHDALFWTQLHAVSSHLSPRIAAIAFVFILVGYGTKVGFVPLHNWLPDAYGEGIAPVLALLSGILLNAAFYAILRCKIIVDGAVGSAFTNHFLIGFGLLNVLVASFFMLRQREIKRLFAYSSIEHVGLISLAFGLGTPLAIFAGMLHIIAHSLSKTAVFFCVGQAIQVRNTSLIDQICGLVHDYPLLGWALLLSSLSLLGVPPFALFTSEFLILLTALKEYPMLTILLVIGLSISFAAILQKVQGMVFTDKPSTVPQKQVISFIPTYLHLLLILILGLLIPVYLMSWSNQIAQLLLRI